MLIVITGPGPIQLDILTDGISQIFSVDLVSAPYRWVSGLPVGTNPAFNLNSFRPVSGTVAPVTINAVSFSPTVTFKGTVATIDFGAVPGLNGATLSMPFHF